MARTIVLHTRHSLGNEGAKQAIDARYASLRASPLMDVVASADMRWEGDTAHVTAQALGAKATAAIAVAPEDVTITIKLPLVLAPFAGASRRS